ncbi:carboxymuconolactone decarboxylase family protein [Smaragdicoccus niigatensis]
MTTFDPVEQKTPRINPGGFRDLGPINWGLAKVISTAAGTSNAKLFSTLGRTGATFLGWLHYSGQLMPGGSLSRRDTEMIILRVAHLRACDYEQDHHRRLGAKAGLTPELQQRIKEGPEAAGWNDKERALLNAVDQILLTRGLEDAEWNELAKHYDERRLIEICLVITQYDGLATTIGVLQIGRDQF